MQTTKPQTKTYWVVGASSGIGEALVKELRSAGEIVYAGARRKTLLERVAGKEKAVALDASNLAQCRATINKLWKKAGAIDTVIYCAGTYIPQRAWELNAEEARTMIETNYLGMVNVISTLLPKMIERQSGHIVVIGSVAGYRGLPKGLIYGPTKAAMINFTEILAHDLKRHHIKVQLVNPGYVKSRLTALNQFKMPAIIEPEEAAREIIEGMKTEKFEIHFPKRFTLFMKLVRILPDRIYYWLVRKM